MDIIAAKYPEFVQSNILDMLVGSTDYQKTKYQQVLNELTYRLSERLIWEHKVFQLEQKLSITPNIATARRIDLCSKVHYLKRNFKYINSIFTIEYTEATNRTPKIFRVARSLNTHRWAILKMEYFAPLSMGNKGLDVAVPIMYAINAKIEAKRKRSNINPFTNCI